MRKNYNEWMSDSIKELTPAGKIKRPSYETVVNWVNRSWNAVDVNLIKRSFKCCGISNRRDGSEDGWIFDYRRIDQTRSNDEVRTPDDELNESEDDESENDDDYEEDYNNDWD